MHRYAPICAGIAVCLAALSCSTPPPPPPAEIWPTTGWSVSTPEAQGMDSDVLAAALSTLRARNIPIHSLLIVRNGHVVLDGYFFPYIDGQPHDVASVTKSVTSMLVGVAIARHAPLALNATIAQLLPGTGALYPATSSITLAELLSMTSGIDCRPDAIGRSLVEQMETSPHWTDYMLERSVISEPGSIFDYCAGNMQLVSAALSRATGRSAFAFSMPTLFAPLGITDVSWPADPDGVSHGYADLRLEPRDLAKLGYLWLHDGRWGDEQIVPADYLKAALAPHATVEPGIQYGLGMWLYPGHVPYDFEANGRGGQRITVIPSLNAVIVVTAGGMDANLVMPLIAPAFRSAGALPANPEGELRLARALAGIAEAPPAMPIAVPPQWAPELAGRAWLLPANPLGVQSLQIDLSNSAAASIRFGFADGSGEVHPAGLDGVPRLSRDQASGLDVAVSARWAADSFAIDYDEIARIDDYRLVLTSVPDGLSIHITERSGLADMTLIAQAAPKGEHLANAALHDGGTDNTEMKTAPAARSSTQSSVHSVSPW